MKKLLTALISAAFIAAPLAVISTPASAAANKPGAAKKHKKAKAKKARPAATQAQ